MGKSAKKPRIPLEALRRLGSHPQTTKKGKKGYSRRKLKEEMEKTIEKEGSLL